MVVRNEGVTFCKLFVFNRLRIWPFGIFPLSGTVENGSWSTLGDDEIDEGLTAEPSCPHVVSFAFYDFEGDGASEFAVAFGELA